MTLDQSEITQTGRWLIFSAIGIGILVITSFISPQVYPEQDSLGFIRQLFALGGPILLRGILAVGIMLYISGIENGDWLDKIGEAPYGPTAVICTVLCSVLRG